MTEKSRTFEEIREVIIEEALEKSRGSGDTQTAEGSFPWGEGQGNIRVIANNGVLKAVVVDGGGNPKSD